MTATRFVLLTLLLAPGTASAQPKPAARLVDGKFGKALDASVTPLAFGGDERYRTPPLTVECWAKLYSPYAFNVLVSSDAKQSSRHWEIYSYTSKGTFSAYLPGYEPSEILSKKPICDNKWHHLAMTFDGKEVRLYVDGILVREQVVKPKAGLKPIAGPLSVGQAIDGSSRVGCDGVIDEVRLSRIVRKIEVPTAPLKVDADTTALFRFEDGETILADPAWTPPPSTTGDPWERETDVEWTDGRLRKMDTGLTFNGTMRYTHDKRPVTAYKATAIRIGDKGEGGVIFDRNQLRLAAGWVGGYLQHSDRRFGLLNTPTPIGTMLFSTASGPGWGGLTGKHPTTVPLPREWGRYNGMYLHGTRVVLSYVVQGVEVLESPWLETVDGQTVVTRTFEVSPSDRPLRLHAKTEVMEVPPSSGVRRFRVVYGDWGKREQAKVLAALEKRVPLPDLRAWTKGGAGRYPTALVTKGEIAKDTAPYVVDTLTVPYDNPHNALFFTSGLDFLPDGRIAVCTCHGDVWVVKADAKLDKVEWRRFATGMYQPLGLKVVDGKIVVLERGQLTRLHDVNGDGEADFYENLCHDWHTGAGEHSYDTCLETDAAGNFYLFKTGDPDLPHGGCLLKVSKDGKKVEAYATGFRHPIGMGVSPSGLVTGADQEGNWMPMTRVDVYKPGGFYGDLRAHHRATPPKTYDGPLVWLPKDVDNSAGGQAWVPHERFGLAKGQMLHLSYGRCKLYGLLTQQVEDVWQAGAADLGVTFLSGAMRARFHPGDGHLYVCGLKGWQTAAKRDGCLQRVRYTGQPLPMPVGLHVGAEGIRIEFAQKLAKSAGEAKRYQVEQWNVRWSADYGSRRWSVRDPSRQGQDVVEVAGVRVLEDGKSVLLQVKDLQPVMMMRIGYDVMTEDGKQLKGAIHNTIHRVEGQR